MKIVTFGELMIRLQPYNYERFVQADHIKFTFGGGEANVAVSAGQLRHGRRVRHQAAGPRPSASASVNALRRYGVDTRTIVRGGRPSRPLLRARRARPSEPLKVCIYDRARSAIAKAATTADFDWAKIFEGADWFHFTGITPALWPGCRSPRSACEACQAGQGPRPAGSPATSTTASKLWTREAGRAEAMAGLMPVCGRVHLQRGGCQGRVRY